MMWRHLASNAVTLLIVGLFLLGGVILWGQREYDRAGPLAEPICLQVKRGSSFGLVSRELEDRGAVRSGVILRLGADYEDKKNDLKFGSYLLEPGTSMRAIVNQVTAGGASTCGTEVVYRVGVNRVRVQVRELDPASNSFVEVAAFDAGESDPVYDEKAAEADTRFRIAVAEGVTSWQIVEALKAVDVLEGDPGDVPPEGALAPESYEVRRGDDRAALLAQMADVQEARVSRVWAGRDTSVPLESPEELLTLASIIEKETGVAEERGQVASVFVNRLNQGMKLQTDPTVIYGVTKGQGVLGRGLRRSELRARTPWNTYVIEGLPPTPIANPGLKSLEAAANPPTTPYIFFVADGTGGHAFAETLDEHNRNVARWREIEKQRQSTDN